MQTRIFLDLDGTLVDPKPAITGSIRHALGLMGCEVPPPDALTWAIGPPLQESLAALLDGDGAAAAEALGHYRAHYGAGGLFECTLYPGIPEALATLRSRGWRLSLATSKPTVFAARIVRHFKLDTLLDDVFGSELDGTRAEKPALLAHVLARTAAEGATGPAAMVGDRRHDVAGGQANAVPVAGALWGYGGAEELSAAGADSLVAHPSDLPAALAALIEGRTRA